jgi:hypothetical protein
LRYDDKIIVPLFDAIQRDKAVADLEGVRELFFKLGIDKVEFDRVWVKDSVRKKFNGRTRCARKLGWTMFPRWWWAGSICWTRARRGRRQATIRISGINLLSV